MAETTYPLAWADLDPTARQALLDDMAQQGWQPEGNYSIYRDNTPKLVRPDVAADGTPFFSYLNYGTSPSPDATGLRIDIGSGNQGLPLWWYGAALALGGLVAWKLA
jgi:hypothetical protein